MSLPRSCRGRRCTAMTYWRNVLVLMHIYAALLLTQRLSIMLSGINAVCGIAGLARAEPAAIAPPSAWFRAPASSPSRTASARTPWTARLLDPRVAPEPRRAALRQNLGTLPYPGAGMRLPSEQTTPPRAPLCGLLGPSCVRVGLSTSGFTEAVWGILAASGEPPARAGRGPSWPRSCS